MTESEVQDMPSDLEVVLGRLTQYTAEVLEGALFILQCRQAQAES